MGWASHLQKHTLRQPGDRAPSEEVRGQRPHPHARHHVQGRREKPCTCLRPLSVRHTSVQPPSRPGPRRGSPVWSLLAALGTRWPRACTWQPQVPAGAGAVATREARVPRRAHAARARTVPQHAAQPQRRDAGTDLGSGRGDGLRDAGRRARRPARSRGSPAQWERTPRLRGKSCGARSEVWPWALGRRRPGRPGASGV